MTVTEPEQPWGIAVNLAEKRKAAGLTQRELAERVGIDHTYVSRIEAGRNTPSYETSRLIATCIGANLESPRPASLPIGWDAIRTTELAALIAERDAARELANDIRDSLEDMAQQFAHQIVFQGVPALTAGGLSALEYAFSVLGWDDPRPCPEGGCQHLGCVQWATCGTPTGDGYKRLCGEHYQAVAATSAPSPIPEECE